MDRQAIMSRALRHGFTLRQQIGGEMDLNEYVYAFAREIFEAGQKAGRAKLDGVTYSMTTSVGMPKWIGLQGQGFRAIGFVFQDAKGRTGSLTEHWRVTWDQGQGFRAIGFVFQDAKGRTGSLTEHWRVTWDQGLAHPAEDDGSLTLSKSDVEFLAARIRRLIKTFDYHEPEKDDRFIVEVAGSLIGGVLRQIEAHPCQGHARQQEAEEAQHLTLVFKLPLTHMQRAVLESAEWTAASWSHAIRDRDAALKEAGCDQGQSAEIKSCDARALKVATARAFEYSGVNISLRDCHSRLIKNHDPDPCSYRMRITDPGCTGCAERDEDQSTEAGG